MSDELITVLGGREAVGHVVQELYRLIGEDPLLAPAFAGHDVFRIQRHMHDFLVAALGGVDVFTGRPLAEAHLGLKITDAMFDRTVGHVTAALRAYQVADPHIAAVVGLLAPARTAVVTAVAEPAPAELAAGRAAAERAFSQTLHLSTMVSYWRAFAAAHGGEVVVSPHYIASRVPGYPSLDQAIVLDSAALDPVLELYGDTAAVGVWIGAEDDETAGKIAPAGFVPGRVTITMAVRVQDVAPDLDPVAIDLRADPSTVVALSGARTDLTRGVRGLSAYATQDAASGLLAFRSGTDAVISLLVTEPARRRQGLATSLLRQALLDLRRQGIRTASMQTNPAGEGVALGIGFRHIGGWRQWVRTV